MWKYKDKKIDEEILKFLLNFKFLLQQISSTRLLKFYGCGLD